MFSAAVKLIVVEVIVLWQNTLHVMLLTDEIMVFISIENMIYLEVHKLDINVL